jgi:NitT/TauT family transport system substrate-binding protein
MRKWKAAQFAVCVLVFILMITACGGNNGAQSNATLPTGTTTASTGSNAPAKKLTKLKVGVLKMAALTDPWIAKQEGIFEKNGLDVNLVEFKSGGDAVSAQQSGDVDIILSIPGTAFTAIERGFDLKVIFQNETAKTSAPDSGSIQVQKDSPINSPKGLAGKKVAISALHSQSAVSVQKVIKDAGVNPKDVQFIEIPTPSLADALKSKQVDAVVTVDPYTTQLTTSGVGKVISWPNIESIPEQPLGAWFAKSKYIKDHPDVIEAFTTSLKEAIDYLLADENRAKDKVAAYTGLDPSLVKNMPLIGWNYKADSKKWQDVIDMMVTSGEMQKPHKVEEFFADNMKQYITK